MRCPECGAPGYRRKTKTPEWRCRKCGHEWDVVSDNPMVDGSVEQTQRANETGHCSQCGSPIRNISAHFCTSCGAEFASSVTSSQSRNPTIEPTTWWSSRFPTTWRGSIVGFLKWTVIGIALAIAIMAVSIMYSIYG